MFLRSIVCLGKIRAGDMRDSRVQWGCARKRSDTPPGGLFIYYFVPTLLYNIVLQ